MCLPFYPRSSAYDHSTPYEASDPPSPPAQRRHTRTKGWRFLSGLRPQEPVQNVDCLSSWLWTAALHIGKANALKAAMSLPKPDTASRLRLLAKIRLRRFTLRVIALLCFRVQRDALEAEITRTEFPQLTRFACQEKVRS